MRFHRVALLRTSKFAKNLRSAPLVAGVGVLGLASLGSALFVLTKSSKTDTMSLQVQQQTAGQADSEPQVTPETADGIDNLEVAGAPDESSSASAGNSTTIQLHTDSSQTSDNGGTTSSNSSNLTVNGQNIDLPKNGSLQQRIKTENGSTRLNISVQTHNETDQEGGATN